MSRKTRSGTRRGARVTRPATYSFAGGDDRLHELFRRQVEKVIATTDANEDEKQQMLMAMNCMCCGLGGSSFTIKLGGKNAPPRRFIVDDGD